MNLLLIFVVGFVIINTLFESFLLVCNMRNISKYIWAGERFSAIMDGERYAKSISYSLAKNQLNILAAFYNSLLVIALLTTGAVSSFCAALSDIFGYSIIGQGSVLFCAFYVYYLLNLPISFVNKFYLEQKYGFNKASIAMWLIDNIKGLIIGAIVVVPLLCLLLKIIDTFESFWWVICAIAWLVLQIFLIWFYPKFIIPAFNKLAPLEDGELKDRLSSLSKRCGFNEASVNVIDSSKRSAHLNAYCSSVGSIQRIVLFDTLVAALAVNEIEAVLAHEIGHHRNNHVAKSIFLSFVVTAIGLKIFAYLSSNAMFLSAFGIVSAQGIAPALISFGLIFPLFTYWLNPLLNAISRKYEYEADLFAKQTASGGGAALISALRSLYSHNLGNLFPAKLYSFFHYSHPTLLEREDFLNNTL